VQGAVEINLEQDRWMVAGPSRGGRLGTGEAQGYQIELIDEGVDHPHRIVLRDIVVQAFGQKQRLPAVFAFDEARHRGLRERGQSLSNQPVSTQLRSVSGPS
jgi:hypothetical protein